MDRYSVVSIDGVYRVALTDTGVQYLLDGEYWDKGTAVEALVEITR